MILVYDTETTGIHYGFKSKSLTDPSHPRLVQLSALVVDPVEHRVHQSMNLVVAPDGWEIPPEASAIHGITEEYAAECGLPESLVLDVFLHLWSGGEPNPLERVGHNAVFDKNVIATAIARYYGEGELLDAWLDGTDFCTMLSSKNIVQAQTKPNAQGKTRLKNPRLEEAHEFFFGESYDRKHTANADVVATMNVYFALQDGSQ